jgi:hypothetical protein
MSACNSQKRNFAQSFAAIQAIFGHFSRPFFTEKAPKQPIFARFSAKYPPYPDFWRAKFSKLHTPLFFWNLSLRSWFGILCNADWFDSYYL